MGRRAAIADGEGLGEQRVAQQLAHHRRLPLGRQPRQQVGIAVGAGHGLLVTERQGGEARVALVPRRHPGPLRRGRDQQAGDLQQVLLGGHRVDLGEVIVEERGVGPDQRLPHRGHGGPRLGPGAPRQRRHHPDRGLGGHGGQRPRRRARPCRALLERRQLAGERLDQPPRSRPRPAGSRGRRPPPGGPAATRRPGRPGRRRRRPGTGPRRPAPAAPAGARPPRRGPRQRRRRRPRRGAPRARAPRRPAPRRGPARRRRAPPRRPPARPRAASPPSSAPCRGRRAAARRGPARRARWSRR